MKLGMKSQVLTSSLGVKQSRPTSSLGVKQSHNPHLDYDTLVKNNTSDGIIHNESNSNNAHYQPIKGIPLPSHRNNIQSNRNSLEKKHRVHKSSENNHFT